MKLFKGFVDSPRFAGQIFQEEIMTYELIVNNIIAARRFGDLGKLAKEDKDLPKVEIAIISV